ncbi:hypothetical protein F5148DRAFT_77583 [Russula earlei]|uniref:Uncharacterized protein n=1 Tax=Russula earlei TaxID=71964 RepID=A0ACC0U9K0_9AGAM|nr:hypothetical protein F5148DRAFT_77583 [Russula earlei]
MSSASASVTRSLASQTAAPSTTQNKSKLAIIIVACVGGFLFIVALILVLVPYLRRRASRGQSKHTKSPTSSGNASVTTVHSRREVHNRTISVDASVPLLEPESNTNASTDSEFLSFRPTTTAESNAASRPTVTRTPNTDTPLLPRRFAPSFKSSSHPLRHARARIAHVPMDTLPEDSAADTSPQRGPSPTTTDTESHAPAPSSWLHIPKASAMPLIGAFRGSISSLGSAASSSLPTMQHYPSFSQNMQSASASSRSTQTFYSVASDGPTANDNLGSPPSEHGELHPPGSAAWLNPGGVGKRIQQVHRNNSSDGFHASRQASMVYSHKSSMLSVPGGSRSGEHDRRPLSGTVASGSSLSFYTDARSQLGAGEDGRWNSSVGGSSSDAQRSPS